MLTTDNFERKFLFVLTRWVALFFIFILLIPVVAGGVYFAGRMLPRPIGVSPDEVIQSIKANQQSQNNQDAGAPAPPSSIEAEPSDDILKSQNLPFVIQKYFSSPDNMQKLRQWLTPLSFGERAEFLQELADVIEQAEKQHVDVINAINTYNQMKQEKISERDADGNDSLIEKEIYLGSMIGCVMMIALFSLVLVLLAIERNTRNPAA